MTFGPDVAVILRGAANAPGDSYSASLIAPDTGAHSAAAGATSDPACSSGVGTDV